MSTPKKHKNSKIALALSPLINLLKNRRNLYMVLVAGIAVLGWTLLFNGDNNGIDQDGWQAVFLENNQVYFGKLTLKDDFYVLANVFYLQTEKTNQQNLNKIASDSVDISESPNKSSSSTKLVKLGNELHAPADQMFIEKSKVLFWENMKDSSAISRSIDTYYTNSK